MERAKVNGVELEYEVKGSGEPVLLISPVVAGAFLPFLSAPALVDRYRLVRYHKRGWGGSTHTAPPVRIADHAADAAALLNYLGVPRAHVAGHSSGGAVALQLAFERPDLVHTLALFEASLFSVPSAQTLFERATHSLDAYHGGDHEGAVAGFLSLVSGLEWETCRGVIDEHVPDGVAQAIRDADTFFGVELPALTAWEFGPEQAAAIAQPVLSVLGTERTGCGWKWPTCFTPGSRRSRILPSTAWVTCCRCSVRSPSREAWPRSSVATRCCRWKKVDHMRELERPPAAGGLRRTRR